jgi:hypothetical protein
MAQCRPGKNGARDARAERPDAIVRSPVTSAVDVVQRRVDACSARDLDAFIPTSRDDIVIYRMPAPDPSLAGKAALAAVDVDLAAAFG